MSQFLIIFHIYENLTPLTFITRANNKFDAVINLIDNDVEGYLVRLIDIGASSGMSNTKSSAKHFKKIFSILEVFDEDDELNEESYNKFKNEHKEKFAEYLEEWAQACDDIMIYEVEEDTIM
jgi:hypothetical protein